MGASFRPIGCLDEGHPVRVPLHGSALGKHRGRGPLPRTEGAQMHTDRKHVRKGGRIRLHISYIRPQQTPAPLGPNTLVGYWCG